MEQQLHAPKKQDEAARIPQLRGGVAAAPDAQASPRRSKKLIRAVKLLDVLTTGDEALRNYLAENQAKCAQAVELAQEDMAEAETPEEAEALRPDPIDELVAQPAPSQPADLQALRDALLAQCRETIAAELVSLAPDYLVSLCGVTGCEVHEIDRHGNILRHIPIKESNADPILRQCRQMLYEDTGIAYIEIHGDRLIPIRG